MDELFLDDPNWETESKERNTAKICHFLCWISLLLPFSGLLVSYLFYNSHFKKSVFVSAHARQAFNFHLAMLLFVAAGFLIVQFLHGGLGVLFMVGTVILHTYGCMSALFAAGKGHYFNFPVRLFKSLKQPQTEA